MAVVAAAVVVAAVVAAQVVMVVECDSWDELLGIGTQRWVLLEEFVVVTDGVPC